MKAILPGSPSVLLSDSATPLFAIAQSACCVRRRALLAYLLRVTTSYSLPLPARALRYRPMWPGLWTSSWPAPESMRSAFGRLADVPRRSAIALVHVYQRVISPLLPDACIYFPTCSQYAVEAIEKYGALRGCLMAARRILRCNPYRVGGYDPVPERPGLARSEDSYHVGLDC